ncbi:hypothetical protein [Oricola cellulosilytica]|uniref:Uncharacterized protein n=1 Tax=Oricola cellulosilytica TaxID=1429082 RepID=A0A4R0PA42_9HYPH|nr:hypothetical protein [Oricola cellulosilytica]TCD14122.1 hypothetical protein E0D97_08485 [Oricola cellulosilytica]
MSRHWLISIPFAFIILLGGLGPAGSDEHGKANVCEILGSLARAMPAAPAGGAGVSLGDYIECVKACKSEFSGPDLTVCIEGCRFIESGVVQGGVVQGDVVQGDVVQDSEEPGVAFSKKDELRKAVIRVAKMLLDLGIDELKCSSITTVDAACCRAWNNLLSTVKGGGNTFDAANRVLVECSGIG